MNELETVVYDANHPLVQEIQAEVLANPVFVYSKGTVDQPRCGYTLKIARLFDMINVDAHFCNMVGFPEKQALLNEMFEWPTLPKIFIQGEFYGGADTVEAMLLNGELEPLLKKALGESYALPDLG